MLKSHKFSTGIYKNIDKIRFRDTSDTSNDYFRLFDIPEKFYVGKNSFRINANSKNLVKGSKIYIDIIDSEGESIYHEISSLVGSDNSRVVIVYIYADTPPGPMKINIAGRAKNFKGVGKVPYSEDPSSLEYKQIPNVVWSKEFIAVTSKANRDEIIFSEVPVVEYAESKANYEKIPSGSNRQVVVSGSAGQTISLTPAIATFQGGSNKFANDSDSKVILDPSMDGATLTSNTTDVTGKLPILISKGFEFNSDMEGGYVIINSLDPTYQANIISVIDKNRAEVDSNYDSGLGFDPQANFTASYWTSDLSLTTVASESFLLLNIDKLEPIAGTVDKINISYKPYGTFGDFINIGSIPLLEENLLVSRGEYQTNKTGLIQKEIGNLKDSSEYTGYWDNISNTALNLDMTMVNPFTFESGFGIHFSGSTNLDNYNYAYLGYIRPKSGFPIAVTEATEYKLEFSARYNASGSSNILIDEGPYQIDIYVTGSGFGMEDIESDLIDLPLYNKPFQDPFDPKDFGVHVGSISTSEGKTLLKQKLYFRTLKDGTLRPTFVFRNGSGWEFKNIKISPRNEMGFSPNTHKFEVPIQSFKLNNELVVRLEYLNDNGVNSGITSELYGLYFSGSDPAVNEVVTEVVTVSGSTTLTDLESKQILFGDVTGSVSQSSLFQWDYDTDTMKVGSTEIDSGSIGFSTRRFIIKRGNQEDLIISGTANFKADGTNDVMKIESGSESRFKVNGEGVPVFGKFSTTPTPVEGGLMYSGSDFWVGL